MTQETWGGDSIQGGCFGSEVSCYTGENSTKCTAYNSPPCPGMNSSAGYYGRGPLQLSYCSNYQAAGDAIGKNLLKDPNILVNDGVAAFEASIWFWMNAVGHIPGVTGKTCHQVINEPSPDFTKTIAIINGGIECEPRSNTSSLAKTEFSRRNLALKRICGYLGITPPQCGTTCNSWAGNGKCYEPLPGGGNTGGGGGTCSTGEKCVTKIWKDGKNRCPDNSIANKWCGPNMDKICCKS
jgi:hypothetical protein